MDFLYNWTEGMGLCAKAKPSEWWLPEIQHMKKIRLNQGYSG
jgi:hypothetical protein